MCNVYTSFSSDWLSRERMKGFVIAYGCYRSTLVLRCSEIVYVIFYSCFLTFFLRRNHFLLKFREKNAPLSPSVRLDNKIMGLGQITTYWAAGPF